MGSNWPYTNLNELNLDWILDVVHDFQAHYGEIDSALDSAIARIGETEADALEEMVQEKNTLLAQLSATQAAALAAVTTAGESAVSQIADDRAAAVAQIEADRAAAVTSIATVRTSAETQITELSTTAINNITTLINSIPDYYSEMIGKMQILGSMLQLNASERAVWQQGSYDFDGVFHSSVVNRVSCVALIGCGGLKLKMRNNASGYEIKGIFMFNGWDDQNQKFIGGRQISNINRQEYEYTFPDDVYCASVEVGKLDDTATSVNDVNVALAWESAIQDIIRRNKAIGSNTELDITPYQLSRGKGINAGTGGELTVDAFASDFIEISEFYQLRYSRIALSSASTLSSAVGLAFYDTDKTYISGESALTGEATEGYQDATIAVPNGAVYVRFTFLLDTTPGARYVYANYIITQIISNMEDNMIELSDALSTARFIPLEIPGNGSGTYTFQESRYCAYIIFISSLNAPCRDIVLGACSTTGSIQEFDTVSSASGLAFSTGTRTLTISNITTFTAYATMMVIRGYAPTPSNPT